MENTKMEGILTIKVEQGGIHTKTELHNVGLLEKAALLNSFLMAIEVDPENTADVALLLALGNAMHEKTVECNDAVEVM